MQSLWSATADNNIRTKSLNGDIKTDVLVIGGGMAGVLCAYRLKQKGVPCVLVEARQIGWGVTKNTTAKITAQHGLIYADLIKRFGTEAARKYYDANTEAIAEFEQLAGNIPCDFERKTAYVYSIDKPQKLNDELNAYHKLGISTGFKKETDLPFKTTGAVGMEGQAQFHPLKLLFELAKGLDIYENAFVREISNNKAVTKNGSITSKHIVLATHFPLINIPGLYFLKLYQHRSYALALQGGPQLDGMYVDEREKGHSFRNHGEYIILGGGDHRTGKKGGGFDELRNFAKWAYPKAQEKFAWATQDCMSLDSVPYIGIHRKSEPNLYVASGFNKWGMTGSMVAANVLCGLITSGKSEYAGLFSPQRSIMRPQLLLNTADAVAGLLSFGKRCTHMGCALKWNPVEHTWDCHCHGSRFDKAGHVIDNPAKKEMKNV